MFPRLIFFQVIFLKLPQHKILIARELGNNNSQVYNFLTCWTINYINFSAIILFRCDLYLQYSTIWIWIVSKNKWMKWISLDYLTSLWNHLKKHSRVCCITNCISLIFIWSDVTLSHHWYIFCTFFLCLIALKCHILFEFLSFDFLFSFKSCNVWIGKGHAKQYYMWNVYQQKFSIVILLLNAYIYLCHLQMLIRLLGCI